MNAEIAPPIVKAVLTASLQGTAVLLFLVALRPWLVRTVPARWRSYLWLLVLVRLLMPSFVLPPSPVSLQNIRLLDRPEEDIAWLLDTTISNNLSAAGQATTSPPASLPVAPARALSPRALRHFSSPSLWPMVAAYWATGVMAFASWFLLANLRLRWRLRATSLSADASISAVWKIACARLSVRRPPQLRMTETVGSPALVGTFAPVLLLPASSQTEFSSEDWEHIFLHELAHFRRRDHWHQALQLLVLCVHWFNPLVWWGLRFLRADRESAADDMALTHLPAGSAACYGGTLLKVLSARSHAGFQPGMIGIMEEVDDLKQRLRGIMAFGSRTVCGSVIGLTLLICLAAAVLGRAPANGRFSGSLLLAAATAGQATARVVGAEGHDPNAYRILLPAERGQILDRDGGALVTNREVHHLGILLPTASLPDAEVVAFFRNEIAFVGKLLSRDMIMRNDAVILDHYKNRRILPFDILVDLTEEEQLLVKAAGRKELSIHSASLRFYPHGELGTHFLGYTGRSLSLNADADLREPLADGVIEGRDGLELVFDHELAGAGGVQTVQLDPATGQSSTKMAEAPRAGRSVITTIDLRLQERCEYAFKERAQRGAMVLLDPHTGEVLALVSWPSYDPNRFIPAVTATYFTSLNEDPALPLVDRATSGLYPPGAIFKIVSGLAAVESGAVKLDEKLSNPPSVQLGDHTFHDWKNADRGMLTFPQALAQNGDTWFYQAGVKTGAQPIVDWASKFGFGKKTGISLRGETSGVLPTEEYLRRKLGQEWKGWSDPWLANLAIGQGIVRVTPLQVAQAMATLANGGSVQEIHLAKQWKDASGKVVGEYLPKREAQLAIRPEVLDAIRQAMVARVSGEQAAAGAAWVEGISVAGQTASVSEMRRDAEISYGWFAGFAPAENPQYAFACVCEGDKEHQVSGGATAAPLVGKILRELFARPAR